jgi:SAM-dependent methyltransferase
VSALRELGTTLRAAGLTPRALAGWAGTDRVSALPARIPALVESEPVPAAMALALFVGGARLPIARLRGLPLDRLFEAGLLARDQQLVEAPLAILPLGPSLMVCDRLDTLDEEDLVAWPDDSSHHLATAIPAGRRESWLDLGCGSGFAQLARPQLARTLTAVDLNPRAVRYARMGAALSGIEQLEAIERGVGDRHAPAELVTCNAPMPGVWDLAIWRRAGEAFFAELWPAVRGSVAPGGMAVIHAKRRMIPDDLPGERTLVAYAPEFAILWWRPDEPDRQVTASRELTLDRPHVDAIDRDDALARKIDR